MAASYGDEVRTLAGLCAECGGRCCTGTFIILSRPEYRRLKRVLDFKAMTVRSPHGSVKTIKAALGQPCPFLGQSGCTLAAGQRPLNCRLFPLTFTVEDGRVKFRLSGLCQFAKRAGKLDKWLKKAKKDALKEFARDWSEKELLCHSHYAKKL